MILISTTVYQIQDQDYQLGQGDLYLFTKRSVSVIVIIPISEHKVTFNLGAFFTYPEYLLSALLARRRQVFPVALLAVKVIWKVIWSAADVHTK